MNLLRRSALLCSVALVVSACASTVTGTAEVGSSTPSVSSSSTAPTESTETSATVESTAVTEPTESTQSTESTETTASTESTETTTSTQTGESTTTSESSETSDTATSGTSGTSKPVPTTAPTTVSTRTSPTRTAVGTSSAPSRSRRTALHCAAGALTAKGGAFCYSIPKNFHDISKTALYPGTDTVKTALGLDVPDASSVVRDVLFVTGTTLSTNSDLLSGTVIASVLDKTLSGGIPGTTKVTKVKQLAVAGDRAFESDITFTDGSQKRYIIIFAGTHRIAVSCQWKNHKAEIAAGCETVLGSLQIKNP